MIDSALIKVSRGRGRGLSPRASFVAIAFVLVALFTAAAAPSPLLVVYQAQWGFAPWLLTLAFAIYALALLLALLVFGSLSDHLGRKPVITAGLLVQIAAMTVFLLAPGIEVVITARILQGLAAGLATGALAAALTDLAPEPNKKLGGVVSSLAPMVGLAFGALATGALIQGTAHASTIVFAVLDGLFVAALVVVTLTRESVTRRPGALRSLVPRVSVPPAARGEFGAGIPVIVGAWALTGFYLALAAAVLRDVFRIQGGLVDGAAVTVGFALAAVSVVVLRRYSARTAVIIGPAALAVGMLLTVFALADRSLALFFLGDVVGGLGIGAAFAGSIELIVPHARAHERGELFAAIYVVSYLSLGVPAIVAGLLVGAFGLGPVANGYAVVDIAFALTGLGAQLARRRAAGR
ncbi:MFS transporter [Amycolatopsis sp. NPDC004368]